MSSGRIVWTAKGTPLRRHGATSISKPGKRSVELPSLNQGSQTKRVKTIPNPLPMNDDSSPVITESPIRVKSMSISSTSQSEYRYSSPLQSPMTNRPINQHRFSNTTSHESIPPVDSDISGLASERQRVADSKFSFTPSGRKSRSISHITDPFTRLVLENAKVLVELEVLFVSPWPTAEEWRGMQRDIWIKAQGLAKRSAPRSQAADTIMRMSMSNCRSHLVWRAKSHILELYDLTRLSSDQCKDKIRLLLDQDRFMCAAEKRNSERLGARFMASELVDFMYIHFVQRQRSQGFKADPKRLASRIGPEFLALTVCALKWGLLQYKQFGLKDQVPDFDHRNVLRMFFEIQGTFTVLRILLISIASYTVFLRTWKRIPHVAQQMILATIKDQFLAKAQSSNRYEIVNDHEGYEFDPSELDELIAIDIARSTNKSIRWSANTRSHNTQNGVPIDSPIEQFQVQRNSIAKTRRERYNSSDHTGRMIHYHQPTLSQVQQPAHLYRRGTDSIDEDDDNFGSDDLAHNFQSEEVDASFGSIGYEEDESIAGLDAENAENDEDYAQDLEDTVHEKEEKHDDAEQIGAAMAVGQNAMSQVMAREHINKEPRNPMSIKIKQENEEHESITVVKRPYFLRRRKHG